MVWSLISYNERLPKVFQCAPILVSTDLSHRRRFIGNWELPSVRSMFLNWHVFTASYFISGCAFSHIRVAFPPHLCRRLDVIKVWEILHF